MILVGQFDSPFVRRVAITLQHYGIEFEHSRLSVFSDAVEMARINPLGRVPSLILDDGETLIDSAAILDHLDEIAGPERALLPARGLARIHTLQLMAIATGAIDKAIAIVYEQRYHEPARQSGEWLSRCKDQLHRALHALEERLQDQWFTGGRFSQADITVAATIGYLRLRMPEVLTEFPYARLAAHAAACERLPAFVATQPPA